MDQPLKAEFEQDGYIIVRGLLNAHELEELRGATDAAVSHRVAPILFEPDSEEASRAVDPTYKDDEGHVFRRLNRLIERGEPFESIACQKLLPALQELLAPPIYVCLNRHNMLMLKAPYNPTPVEWHQDSAIWNEGTFEHVSAIVALDDFLPENGGLQVVPGSHQKGTLGLGGENIPTVRHDSAQAIANEAVHVDLKAGDALLFHGLLLHGSPGNQTAFPRRSMTFAYFSGDLREISTKTGEAAPQVREITVHS